MSQIILKRVLWVSLTITNAVFAAEPPSGKDLAKAVLEESGIHRRFDSYLLQGITQVSGGAQMDPKITSWMQQLWIQELGWRTVEEAYVSHFESRFTQEELEELLELSKRPVVQKLIQEELLAYQATQQMRSQKFSVFWQRYNASEFDPPQELLPAKKKGEVDEFGDEITE